jgi:hypothetical protein
MATPPKKEFGKRRPVVPLPVPSAPVKRSNHVALLLMGTLAVGGGAYALMPRESCEPTSPGMASPATPSTECRPRGSSSGGSGGGGGGSRSGFFSGDSASSHSASGPSDSGSGGVTRGGFGSFAHSFTSHFSGGG